MDSIDKTLAPYTPRVRDIVLGNIAGFITGAVCGSAYRLMLTEAGQTELSGSDNFFASFVLSVYQTSLQHRSFSAGNYVPLYTATPGFSLGVYAGMVIPHLSKIIFLLI